MDIDTQNCLADLMIPPAESEPICDDVAPFHKRSLPAVVR